MNVKSFHKHVAPTTQIKHIKEWILGIQEKDEHDFGPYFM